MGTVVIRKYKLVRVEGEKIFYGEEEVYLCITNSLRQRMPFSRHGHIAGCTRMLLLFYLACRPSSLGTNFGQLSIDLGQVCLLSSRIGNGAQHSHLQVP